MVSEKGTIGSIFNNIQLPKNCAAFLFLDMGEERAELDYLQAAEVQSPYLSNVINMSLWILFSYGPCQM